MRTGREEGGARSGKECRGSEKESFVLQPTTMPVMQGPSSQTIVKLVHNGLQFIELLLFLLRNNATYHVCPNIWFFYRQILELFIL